MSSPFEDIKKRVPIGDAVRFYGFQPNQRGYICCPFHSEKTPSLKLYEGSNTWHCYGCHEGGDIISFVAKLCGLQPINAARKLNADFNLGLTLDGRKPTRTDRKAAERRRTVDNAAAAFENWRDDMLRELYAAHRAAQEVWWRDIDSRIGNETDPVLLYDVPVANQEQMNSVLSDVNSWADGDADAIRQRERLDYYIDILSGTVTADTEAERKAKEAVKLAAQMEVFRSRKEVKELCARITRRSPMKS